MLGWHITVYRQETGGGSPASFDAPTGASLAVWQTGLSGLDWIDELVNKGLASCLGGNGYPTKYTAQLKHLQETILGGPPHANQTWHHDEGDVLTEKWLGKTTIDHAALSRCDPDQWVLLEVWDES